MLFGISADLTKRWRDRLRVNN